MSLHHQKRDRNLSHVRVRLGHACVVLFAVLSGLDSTDAQAIGQFRLESNGFLRNSTDRANSSQTIAIGPQLNGQGKYLESNLDVQGIVQVSDKSTFTVEGSNAYVATSSRLSDKFQVTIGRRTQDWSAMDDYWEFGTYSPRFIWDPTRPQKIGLTGLFAQVKTHHLEVTGYASPLSVPERGFPTREENGLIKSSNPFYTPLYEFVEIQDRIVPVRYDIEYPPMGDLLFNAGGALSMRFQKSPTRGAWIQATAAYLPIHQVQLNAEVDQAYNPATDRVEVKVYPEILMHSMFTVETGLKAKRFSLWGSVTQESPEKRNHPSTWKSPVTEDAVIAAVGAEGQITKKITIRSSFIHIDEEPRRVVSEDDNDITIDLPSRFPYHRAVKSELAIASGGRMSYDLGWTHDFQHESDIFSVDATYQIWKKTSVLTLNAGADFFASATSKGYVGQYKGNDRIRGTIAYAF